ncbi:MAG: type II secretion system F family protein [Candidatus Sungbacteria bacterium]|nr:type II secretion system F family protein [Candidatus Sungbacteria bacterium]
MPSFEYKARTKTGEIRSGIIETSSQDAALDALHRNELTVIAIHAQAEKSLFEMSFGGRVKQKDVVILSRQLATLFEAQIPVIQSLRTLASDAAKPKMRLALTAMIDDVNGGLALSQALAKHPHIFSLFYVNLIRAAEESGKLQEVFLYLADYLERSYYLTTKARNAMIYPIFVFSTFIIVMILMLTIIMPRLTVIFEQSNVPIPLYTKAIIALSLLLRQWGIVLLIALIGGAVALWRWVGTPKGKRIAHKLQLKVPVFGELYQKLYMTRFADNLRTLIVGGIPIIRALTITSDVVGNVIFQEIIQKAVESVKGGNTISAALERSPEVPILVTQMIRIGESSGRLDFILGSIARFYQKEVDSLVENLVALIEPIMIVLLGLGVGVLVASVLVPIYNLIGSF